VRFEALGIGTDEELPNGPVEMLIARTSVAPGVTIPPQPHSGPEVGVIEAGSFTFHTAAGPGLAIIHGLAGMTTAGVEPTLETTGPDLDVTANAGDAFFVPTGSVSGGTAGLDAEVIALSGSLAPRGVVMATPES
jgi:quercetin dioxygenase-like cupin family protein